MTCTRGMPLSTFQFPSSGHCTSRSMRQGRTFVWQLIRKAVLQEPIQGPQMGHDRAERLPRCWRGYVYQLHGLEHCFWQSCTSTCMVKKIMMHVDLGMSRASEASCRFSETPRIRQGSSSFPAVEVPIQRAQIERKRLQ